ncbi:hypothetical protein FHT71_006428 [Rhizobium sp. BK060]|nr:hypothetical protein [Rhizobium sp. BK060]
MMNSYAAAGVRDAIAEGTAKLGLPLSPGMLSMIRCENGRRCGRDRCPICASRLTERFLALDNSTAAFEGRWRRSAFAIRSHTVPAKDTRPIPIPKIREAVKASLDCWVRASRCPADTTDTNNFGCIATFGLVEDVSSPSSRDKVLVVEYSVTGVDRDADYDVFESLQYSFGDNVEDVPLFDDVYRAVPDQGLLFGYTKRRLNRLDRPKPISSATRLARLASNYGDHPKESRLLSRGLENQGEDMVFEKTELFGLSWWYLS